MKTKFKSTISAIRHSFFGVVCLGVVLLISSSAQAQNLFVGSGGNILEFTPGGVESTFASGLSYPTYLAVQPVPGESALGLLAVGAAALLVRRRRNLAADFNPDQKPRMPSNRNFRVIPRRLLAGLTVLVRCALAHGSTVSIVTPNSLTGSEGNTDRSEERRVGKASRTRG